MWQSFHATARTGAVFIGTVTAAIILPDQLAVGKSSYLASKSGLIRLLEILAAEEKNISVRILHPGIVWTDMAAKSTANGVELPLDQGPLEHRRD